MRLRWTLTLMPWLIGLTESGCDSAPGEMSTLGTGGSTSNATATEQCSDPSEPINDEGGCTPAPMLRSGTLKGTSGATKLCVGNRQYYLQVNEWNSTAAQQMGYGRDGYFFKMLVQDGIGDTSGGPAGYPSMFIGANGGRKTLGSGLPKQVSLITAAPTTWNWKDAGLKETGTSNIYNAAYDVWFSVHAEGDPRDYNPSGGFLMVWLHKPNSAQPIGSVTNAKVTIEGISGTWDVWVGENYGAHVPCISYVRADQDPTYSMSFDLNRFIRDAVANRKGTITNDMYLTNIFAGFEIWSGGVGLETTSFCAAVM